MMNRSPLFTISLCLVLLSCNPTNDTNTETTTTDSTTTTSSVTTENMDETIDETTAPSATTKEASYFICYKSDTDDGLFISISFDDDGKAVEVTYKGQDQGIPLVYDSENMIEGGAHPTIETLYKEMHEGQENGQYLLIHSGIWDYVEYTRKKDGKVFNFTIDHDITVENNEYRTTPCF